MRVGISVLSIVAAAGLACPVMAQDSTSKNSDGGSGLPGDALSPWVVGVNQKSSYIVDMVPLYTSQGTQFGVAPVIKTSKVNATFFSSLWGPQTISQTIRTGVPYWESSYTLWTVPTAGVNPSENNQGAGYTTAVTPQGNATALAVALRDSSADPVGQNTTFDNNVIGGLINYDPADPSRLYVTRVVAATDGVASGAARTASFGVGGVDANGNLHFRADDFSCTAANKIVGVNYFRVRLAGATGRNSGLLNVIAVGGANDAVASDWLLKNAVSTTNQHGTPTCIPEDIAGRPVLLGSNFNIQYVHEKVAYYSAPPGWPGLTNEPLAAYLPAPATDIRGNTSFTRHDLFFAGAGTVGILAKNGAPTDGLGLFGVDAAGNPISKYDLQLPVAGVADPCEQPPSGNFIGVFDGYRSQVGAQGGNGCVAIGKDRFGRGLAAGVVYTSASAQNPLNAIAVARFDPNDPNNTTQWSLAAWADNFGSGKPIHGDFGLDGAPFSGDAGEFDGFLDTNPLSPTYDAPIGRLAIAPEQAGLLGPTMSSPTIDSAGNVYFLSIVALNKKDANGVPFTDIDTGLIRAIYDSTNFCYNLDLMMELGDTYMGANSSKRYQVQFLDVMDSNSVSSGTIWSTNANQVAWNNINEPAYRDVRVPENLGGLVIGAKIVYDVDGDADFQDPTSAGGDPTSADEAYNVMFYIGNMNPALCPADFNNDGFIDPLDYNGFINAFEANDPIADFNGDGFLDPLDYNGYINAFETPCP